MSILRLRACQEREEGTAALCVDVASLVGSIAVKRKSSCRRLRCEDGCLDGTPW